MKYQRRLVLLLAAASLACAPAGREGEAIHIAEEAAIIIWDAASKTQHFIRRASFETQAKDFGFLVPTPTQPKLAEASDEAFRHIEKLVPPPPRQAPAAAPKGEVPKSAPPPVQVLERKQLAGYDAAVLSASDSGALDAWLKENGYASSPQLMEWADAYIQKKWILTAFKIAGEGKAARLDSSAVRMSFLAEQPYFPYREPREQPVFGMRRLKIYFLGESRAEGSVGGQSWSNRVTWSGDIGEADQRKLAELLKLEAPLPAGLLRLTVFSDASTSREGDDDLVFTRAGDQSPVSSIEEPAGPAKRRFPWLTLIVVVSFVVIAGIAVLYTFRRRRQQGLW